MKKYILALLMLPVFAHADVPTRYLMPVVKIYPDTIEVRAKSGEKWIIETNCDYNIDDITDFKVKGRQVKEGTNIRLSNDQICKVKSIRQA